MKWDARWTQHTERLCNEAPASFISVTQTSNASAQQANGSRRQLSCCVSVHQTCEVVSVLTTACRVLARGVDGSLTQASGQGSAQRWRRVESLYSRGRHIIPASSLPLDSIPGPAPSVLGIRHARIESVGVLGPQVSLRGGGGKASCVRGTTELRSLHVNMCTRGLSVAAGSRNCEMGLRIETAHARCCAWYSHTAEFTLCLHYQY